MLSSLASARGISLADLVNRVMQKHWAYSVLSGVVIRQRQALENRLDICETIDDVNAIEVTINVSVDEN